MLNIFNLRNLSIGELKQISPTGFPSTSNMFSKDLISKVNHTYKEDIKIYSEKIGVEKLLFK